MRHFTINSVLGRGKKEDFFQEVTLGKIQIGWKRGREDESLEQYHNLHENM